MDLSPQNTNLQSFEQNQAPKIHPISKLPPEIISEIFLHFLPAYPECPEHPGLSSPLLLCAICRKWRAIAIGTPELWRAIRMSASNDSRLELTAQFEFLPTWLSRSGNYPLSLSIPYQTISRDLAVEARLLQMAILHRERWEQADLNLTYPNLHFLQGPMPLLRHLTFGLTTSVPVDATPAKDFFACAPRLTDVVLTWNFEKSAMNLPWRQLTHLRAYCLYLEECVEIIRDAVSLIHCDFGICGTRYTIPSPTLPIHPYLSYLAMQLASGAVYYPDLSLLPLFANLTTPALHSLRVYEPGVTLQSLQVFFSRSCCSLQELRVDKSSVPESTYRAAFPFVNTIILEEL